MSYDDTKVDVTGTTYDAADTKTIWAEDWNSFVAAYKTHAARHKTGGADPIKLDELASPTDNVLLNVSIAAHGLCPKLPNDTAKYLRGDGTWAAAVPASHTHPESEVISLVTDLAGKAAIVHTHVEADTTNLVSDLASKADASHVHAGTDITSSTIDGDRLPAMSVTKKGGVPATGTPSGKFLRDDGSFNTVGTMSGSTGGVDNAALRANGTGGDTLQNSLAVIDDAGSINIPSNQQFKVAGSQHVHVQADVTSIDHGLLAGLTDDDHARYFDKDGTKALTGNGVIQRDVNDSQIAIRGGSGTAGSGAEINLYGNAGGAPGYVYFYVPDAAKTARLIAMRLIGNTDTPYLDMNSHQIKNLYDPTAAQDAATKNYVDTTTFALDGSRALTGTTIKRSVDNSYISIRGGSGTGIDGAVFEMLGSTYATTPGSYWLYVPNAAKTAFLKVYQIIGVTDTPYLDMLSHQIKNLLDPTSAQDAATMNYVDTKIAEAIANMTAQCIPAYFTATNATLIPALASHRIVVHTAMSNVSVNGTVRVSGIIGGSPVNLFAHGPGTVGAMSSTPDVICDTNTAVSVTVTTDGFGVVTYYYVDA